jgi:O-antigen/teichoic acid export membrane protein
MFRLGLTRRRLVAFAGVYGSVALGLAASLVVLRVLGPSGAGRFTIVIGAADFLALLVWLTSDDALVKYGFRYAANEEWGRFRRLIRIAFTCELAASFVATALIVALVPLAGSIFEHGAGLEAPLLVAATLPPLQALESIAAATLILGGRYDLRGTWLTLSMGLRLAGIAAGARYGVTAAVVGVVAAQVITTVSILAVGLSGLRRFPTAPDAPIGDDRGPIMRFVVQSAAYTGLISIRLWVAPLTLGIVRNAASVGLFRAAQMPQSGLAALSSPLRMILLSEQTRDWEHGRPEVVLAGIRRYVKGSAAIAALALVPALLTIPWLVRHVLGAEYVPAVPAARLILVAAAIQLVLSWTKTFPVTIGRPGLRLIAHGVETAVMLPLIVVLGRRWGVTGAGAAVLVSSGAFAVAWAAILLRLRRTGFSPSSRAPSESSARAARPAAP